MTTPGPIIMIDDDVEDLEIFKEIINEFAPEREVIEFGNSDDVLTFLDENTSVNPFLIISDINLPKLSGIALREKIQNNEQLRLRCIPYLFFTTSSAHQDVIDAYSKSIQGFFIKPANLDTLKSVLQAIITYWSLCEAPNPTKEQHSKV